MSERAAGVRSSEKNKPIPNDAANPGSVLQQICLVSARKNCAAPKPRTGIGYKSKCEPSHNHQVPVSPRPDWRAPVKPRCHGPELGPSALLRAWGVGHIL